MLAFSLKGFKNVWMLKNLAAKEKSFKGFSLSAPQILRFSFSTLRKSDRQSSQSLLKQYFSSRLTLSTSQLEGFIIQLSKNNDVKIRDHRWESLYMTIQKYNKDFSLQSKIEINFLVQALGRMRQNNQLFLTLYKSIVAQFHKLTIEQMAVLLWSMVKAQQNDKNILLAIYKKIHKILQNDEKIRLYKEGEQLPIYHDKNFDDNENAQQIIHHIHESYFVQLIWAIQRTKTIDEKLILDLLKFTFKEQNFNNLEKLRIQNLCLLAYCMEELKLQKYRISQTMINQIMKLWEELQKLSFLTLVLLCGSFSKFVYYQQQYLNQYESKFSPQQILKKQNFISKERKFIFLIIQTIFLRQNRSLYNIAHNKNKKKFKRYDEYEDEDQLRRLENPLSSKFASQIIFQLGKLNLYEKNIWYKLLSSITDDVDHAEIQDLSMALAGICKLNTKEISSQEVKQVIYQHKKILCRRVFQIYTSITGRSLQNIKELVFEKKIQNEFVPSRIRREIQKELQTLKMEQNSTNEHSEHSERKSVKEPTQQDKQQSQMRQKVEPKSKDKKRQKNSVKKGQQKKNQEQVVLQNH